MDDLDREARRILAPFGVGCVDTYPEHQRGDAWEGPEPSGNGEHEPAPELGILLSTVEAECVEWLWPGRIPLGKLSIIDGDPGLGKSVLTLDLAARVTLDGIMPDGVDGRQGGVVLLSAEDGLADTIVPRLQAAGARLDRIKALDVIPFHDEQGAGDKLPSLPLDVPYIRDVARQMNAVLVVVDPIMAYLGERTNSHKDQDCRRALHPLARMAEETGAAVVVVRHLNKLSGGNPLYRGGGSIGIIGAARSGLLVARDPDDPERRVLASLKSNLAKAPSSLAFALDEAPNGAVRVGWTGPSPHTAESLLAAPRDDEERGAVGEAVEVLRTILAGGAVSSKDVKASAGRAGVSEVTLRRAKSLLQVKARLVGFGRDGQWHWSLPEPESGRDDQRRSNFGI